MPPDDPVVAAVRLATRLDRRADDLTDPECDAAAVWALVRHANDLRRRIDVLHGLLGLAPAEHAIGGERPKPPPESPLDLILTPDYGQPLVFRHVEDRDGARVYVHEPRWSFSIPLDGWLRARGGGDGFRAKSFPGRDAKRLSLAQHDTLTLTIQWPQEDWRALGVEPPETAPRE